MPSLMAAQPGAQHPQWHNRGPNPAILRLTEGLEELLSPAGCGHRNLGWPWPRLVRDRGAHHATAAAGASLDRGCCCLPHPPAGMRWEQPLQPPPNYHLGHNPGVLSSAMPVYPATPAAMLASPAEINGVRLRGTEGCVSIFNMCFAQIAAPAAGISLFGGFPGSEPPVAAPSVGRGRLGLAVGCRGRGGREGCTDPSG